MEMNFFDWAYLGTFAGATAAVMLITELIKNIPILSKIPTQLVSWVLAYVVITLAQAFTGTLNASAAVINVLNAAMVGLSANGGYAAVKRVIGSANSSEE